MRSAALTQEISFGELRLFVGQLRDFCRSDRTKPQLSWLLPCHSACKFGSDVILMTLTRRWMAFSESICAVDVAPTLMGAGALPLGGDAIRAMDTSEGAARRRRFVCCAPEGQRELSGYVCCGALCRLWPVSAVNGRAEHVCSARVFQTSTCSAIARASSTSMPRYLTVLSILVWPSKSWTARRLPVRR